MRAHPRTGVVAGLLLAVVAVGGCGPAGDATGPGSPGATGVATTASSTSTSAAPATSPATTVAPGTTGYLNVDGRPFRLHVPASHQPGTPEPLLVGLHGYSSRSEELDRYLGLTAASDERGFLLALPDGNLDSHGEEFWNAVDGGCCDLDGTGVDDSGYLSDLVTAVRAQYAVDRVAVVGHSNGGYMAHRFACDHADQVDAIASLAGPLPADTSRCAPSRPVAVLHIHGTSDSVVPYDGRAGDSSARATAETWARLDGCAYSPLPLPVLDLDSSVPGAETGIDLWVESCPAGVRVELWTIHGAGHVPALTEGFTPAVLDFLLGS